MRVLVLGGTRFIGRRIVERLRSRGDEVMVAHRGRHAPEDWVAVEYLLCDRRELAEHRDRIRGFDPEAIVDTIALTGADVDAVLPALPEVPAVVLSSQDVYEAYAGLQSGAAVSPLPIDEDSPVRGERHPLRGQGVPGIPEDYEKLDVEERWRGRGATVLRLPLTYGPHDWQRREEPLLRRLRAGRDRIPVGAANMLWTRGHVEDVASGVLAALDARAADGLVLNLGEPRTMPVGWWFERILEAAGSEARLVRVPEHALPADLELSAAPSQHLLVSVSRAAEVLGLAPADPAARIAESVRWHLDNPPGEPTWTAADAAGDEEALRASS